MHDFTYHAASSVADAAAKLAAGEDAVLMAGGMTLLPTLKQRLARPSDVIDLAAVGELRGITVADGTVTIGAMTTHDAVANSAEVSGAIPALAALAGRIGDPQVRNRGTIGGSISNNDPAADYPAALVGLGATVRTDRRAIAADDFFTGMFETALEDGEIVVSVSFPVPDAAAYMKFPNPASRYAIVGVLAAPDGRRRAGRRHGCGRLRLPRGRDGIRPGRGFLAGRHRRHDRFGGRPQRGHPCLRRVPCASGRRDGAPRGRGLRVGPWPGSTSQSGWSLKWSAPAC